MIEIKPREILISVIIFLIMFAVGLLGSSKVTDWQDDQNASLYKAVRIDNDPEAFAYGTRTSVGHALTYGHLSTNGPVTSEYTPEPMSWIQIDHEEYQMHTRTVTKSSGSGKNKRTWTEDETYWTWDRVGTTTLTCEGYNFLGRDFKYSDIYVETPSDYIGTFDTGHHKRDICYSIPSEFDGTMSIDLNAENNEGRFYANMTIDDTVEYLEKTGYLVLYWVVWMIATGGLIYGFLYLNNDWVD